MDTAKVAGFMVVGAVALLAFLGLAFRGNLEY